MGEDAVEQLQGIGVLVLPVGDVIVHQDIGELRLPVHLHPAFAVLLRLFGGDLGGLRPGRQFAEGGLDLLQGLLGLDVPHHHQGAVVGLIVAVVIILIVLQGDALDVVEPADYRPLVRVGLEGGGQWRLPA